MNPRHRTGMRTATVLACLVALTACSELVPIGDAPQAESTMSTNHHIDYVEFAAPDIAAARKFYEETFGWTFQEWGPGYSSFSGSGLEGGFRGGETPENGTTLVILYADDLDATEARIRAGGGEILERHEFPGGKRFHFRDPSGNVLAVWTKLGDE